MVEWTLDWLSSPSAAAPSSSQQSYIPVILSDFYQYIIIYANDVFELLGMNKLWKVDHTILIIWFLINLSYALIRRIGTYKRIISQLAYRLSIAFIYLTFMRLSVSVRKGDLLFGEKLTNPTMGTLAVGLKFFEVIMDGIKHRRLIFDTIKKIIGLLAV